MSEVLGVLGTICRGCSDTWVPHDPQQYWDALCVWCRGTRKGGFDALDARQAHNNKQRVFPDLCVHREIESESFPPEMNPSYYHSCEHPDMVDDLRTVLLRANGSAYDV